MQDLYMYALVYAVLLQVFHIHALLCARGCIFVCTPVFDHLGIIFIKPLFFCHDAGAVENLVHQYV